MSRNKPRVRYELDSGDIGSLTIEEIKVILRAADELIAMRKSNRPAMLGIYQS